MISFDRLGLSTPDVLEAVDCILAKKVGYVRLINRHCVRRELIVKDYHDLSAL